MAHFLRKVVLWTISGLFGLYLAAMGLTFAKQRALLYPAPTDRAFATGLPHGFREIVLRTSDDLRLQAIYRPASGALPTLVFFHGNGDNLKGAMAATGTLADAGYGMLLVEYRGYSGNPGSPTEAGLYRDGEAALRWLSEAMIPLARTILVGNSLGSGVATQLASSHDVAGLILISGYARLADVAALHVRIFPVRLLLLDRYDNAAKLPRVTAPVLLLHGAADSFIPPGQSEELARLDPRAKLVLVPNAGHELAYLPQSQSIIAKWLSGLEPASHPLHEIPAKSPMR